MRDVSMNDRGLVVMESADRRLVLLPQGDGRVFDLIVNTPRGQLQMPVSLRTLLVLSWWTMLHCLRSHFWLGAQLRGWRQRRALLKG